MVGVCLAYVHAGIPIVMFTTTATHTAATVVGSANPNGNVSGAVYVIVWAVYACVLVPVIMSYPIASSVGMDIDHAFRTMRIDGPPTNPSKYR